MLKKISILLLYSAISFQFCCAVEKSKCSMAMVADKVNSLQSFVKDANAEKIRETYAELQSLVNKLNDEAKVARSSSLSESGDEACGDYYTEFRMLLNRTLAPLRIDSTRVVIAEALKLSEKRD